MKPLIEGSADVLDRGLRRLVAAFGGRMEFAARFERPIEALAEDFLRERPRARRGVAARKDFERAWKTY
ncbi:MAG TPA: hypothetical protein VH309_12610 [Elusimicrobiota bacterium]|jgi:hypothetical protein|nr:hypothetical protein [Elusimicrobiota bacterium]